MDFSRVYRLDDDKYTLENKVKNKLKKEKQ